MTLRITRLIKLQAPSLSAQLLIAMTITALLVGLISGLITHDTERGYLNSLLASESEHKFQLLVFASSDDVVSRDIPRLQTTMQDVIRRDKMLASAKIVDSDGHVLFAWTRDYQGPKRKLLSLSYPIRVKGELFGEFSAGWDLSDAKIETARHAYWIAGEAGGVCLVLGLFAYLLMRFLAVAPINAIAECLIELRRGVHDRSVVLPAFVPRELKRLAEAVNTLGELLASKEQRDIEREAARDAAVSANRTKSEFLANMSHELRTPLNAIMGFSEIMERQMLGPVGTPKYREYASDINASAAHLLSIINDILDISKIEFGKLRLAEEEYSLEPLIRGTMMLVRERATQAGLLLIDALPANLPRVVVDERKIKQILINLLSNAVKFTPPGGTVSVGARVCEAGLLIEVADTGIGIPEDQIAKALEPFGQVDSSLSRRHEGSGLGLPLVKALVDLHGGTLEVTSQLGAGTRVAFTLPRFRLIEPVASQGTIVRLASYAGGQERQQHRPDPSADTASIAQRAVGGGLITVFPGLLRPQ